MRANKKIMLSMIAGVSLAASFTTVGVVVGTNQAALSNGNVIYDSSAENAALVQKPKPIPPIASKPELMPETPTPAVLPAPRETQNRPSESTAELIARLTDNGESASLVEGHHSIGGVGSSTPSIRRNGLVSNTDPNDKFNYGSFSLGSQDSAEVLGKLIANGVTLDNLPRLSEPISLSDIEKLKENSLFWVPGQKVINLDSQTDKDKLLKEINENVQVSFFNGGVVRGSLNDLVNLGNAFRSGTPITGLTKPQKDLFDVFNTIINFDSNKDYYANNTNIFNGVPKVNVPNSTRLMVDDSKISPSDLSVQAIKNITLKLSFNAQELNTLEQGLMPTLMNLDGSFGGTSQPRPAFVNAVQFKRTQDNMNRFLSITSNWERTENDILNLNFKPNAGEGQSGYDKKDLGAIKGYEDVANLLEYTSVSAPNNIRENRYIINIHSMQNLASKAKPTAIGLIDAARNDGAQNGKMQFVSPNSGIGVAIRNINATTADISSKFIASMPNLVKSLTLFYDWNNPQVVNALIDNPNYNSPSTNLTELNIYTDLDTPLGQKNPDVDKATNLTRIDPRVYQKVNPTAFDYGYNAIFNTLSIKANSSRQDISNAMNYAYVQGKNRREFQGSFGGEGGYPVNWNFQDNNQWDMNNVNVPRISNFSKFQKITYASLVGGVAAPLDLQNLKIDNTDKVQYQVDDVTKGVFFANSSPNNPQAYVKVIGGSNRSTSANLATINNYANSAWQYIRNIDLRDYTDAKGTTYSTGFNQQAVESASWPKTVEYIYYGNNQVYKNPNAYPTVKGNPTPPVIANGTFQVSADSSVDVSGNVAPVKVGNSTIPAFDSIYKGNVPSPAGNDRRLYISLDNPQYNNVSNDIYNALNDYTSKIIVSTNIDQKGKDGSIITQPNSSLPAKETEDGTAWILDYQKTSDGSYPTTWYYGTNMHVIANMNNNKNNLQPNEFISIGKYNPVTKTTEFTTLQHETYPEIVFEAKDFINNKSSINVYDQRNPNSLNTLDNYFKDFAVIKVTYPDQATAKKATADFATKYRTPKFKFDKAGVLGHSSQTLVNNKNIYVLGFPLTGGTSVGRYPVINKRTGSVDRNNGQSYANSTNNQFVNNYDQSLPGIYDIRRIVDTSDTTTINGIARRALDLKYQGNWYQRFGLTLGVDDTNLQGGASGSLVVDGNGNVLGIYWGTVEGANTGLVDAFVSPELKDANGHNLLYGYDLINGGGVNQTNSFKQWLQKQTDSNGKNALADSWLFGSTN
ncbi:MIP family Ig-specific serine endopeptidase [[Mycoplasma] testudinis]|uniref:MIP family Ig-specific serine endopeptidase n=1 Tax=[Mycoplasma] testudinis TaxID=33924 RepID=UPI0004890565|nr:hypothetical protein [[Mycoplasma] testudinis]